MKRVSSTPTQIVTKPNKNLTKKWKRKNSAPCSPSPTYRDSISISQEVKLEDCLISWASQYPSATFVGTLIPDIEYNSASLSSTVLWYDKQSPTKKVAKPYDTSHTNNGQLCSDSESVSSPLSSCG